MENKAVEKKDIFNTLVGRACKKCKLHKSIFSRMNVVIVTEKEK